ncbi:hypothetical protein QFC21_002616 [Naganishia friedmannii]|uniref:Uncharacterized protein n=1 Tax=Naganishia friedmannii TaxID=89922 RepID=A0ACC2VUV8_9TREE|nr:hypothetical protein QFC21_002616 [Naganishia friedmannii]
MPFDTMRALMREKVKPIFGSKSNGNKSGYQPISSPTITSQPGHKKSRVLPKTPLPLLTYSASGGCPTRHRPDLARHNSSDEDVTAYMQKKVDFLMRNSDERGWRVMAHHSVGHGKTLTFPMQSEKINNLLTELEALVMTFVNGG